MSFSHAFNSFIVLYFDTPSRHAILIAILLNLCPTVLIWILANKADAEIFSDNTPENIYHSMVNKSKLHEKMSVARLLAGILSGSG
jgi:hypothetical protein